MTLSTGPILDTTHVVSMDFEFSIKTGWGARPDLTNKEKGLSLYLT